MAVGARDCRVWRVTEFIVGVTDSAEFAGLGIHSLPFDVIKGRRCELGAKLKEIVTQKPCPLAGKKLYSGRDPDSTHSTCKDNT